MSSKFPLALLALSLLAAAPARASARFSVVWDALYSRPQTQNISNRYTGRWNSGYGALLEVPIFSRLGIELGGLYLRRSFNDSANGAVTSTLIETPLLFRLWISRVISVGLGGYGTLALGNLVGQNGAQSTYHDYGLQNFDYGLVGSLGLNLPIGRSTALFLDSRFTQGGSNASRLGGKTLFRYQDAQFLVGFRIGSVLGPRY